MKELKFRLKGLSPLLLHNARLANPLDPYTRKLNTLSKKGRGIKDESDIWEVAKLEWFGSLYTKERVIGIPGNMLFTVIRDGARKFKKGKTIEAGLIVREFYPLTYDGPSDPDELFEYSDGEGNRLFVDLRMVGIQRNKVLRCRPYFSEWSLNISITVDDRVIEDADMIEYLEAAGIQCGFGDARSLGYGRFAVEQV